MVNHPCVLQDSASIVKLALLNKPTACIVGLGAEKLPSAASNSFSISRDSSTLCMAVKIMLVHAVCIYVLLPGKHTVH